MEWLSDWFKARDDRHEIARLRYEIEDLDESFKQAEKHPMPCMCDECRQTYGRYWHEHATTAAAIDQIETRRAVSRALYWEVPIPTQPPQLEQDNEFWAWNDKHRTYYLTDAGIAHLRRQVFLERDIRSRPWLSWGAFILSCISISIAFLKA